MLTGLIVLIAGAWFLAVTKVAVKNWNTPQRLDKMDKVINETIPAINTDIASVKTSIGHLSEQVNVIYGHVMKQPPNPTPGHKPAPNDDSEQ